MRDPSTQRSPASGSIGGSSLAEQFFGGAFALVRGCHFIWRTRAAWPYAAVPVLVCLGLCVVAVAGSIWLVPRALHALWPELERSLGAFGSGLVEFVVTVASAMLGLLSALLATPPLSAPALERLVILRERALGVPARPSPGALREFWCALQAQVFALAVFSPILAGLSLLTWLVPPVAAVTVVLQFIVLSMLWAFSLLDYPLSLQGAGLSLRLRLLRAGFVRVLGFGSALAVAFAVPLFPILLLPAAVAAAAEIGVALERDNPRQ